MKHLFLSAAIFLFTSLLAPAQIVNIPDVALKQYLINFGVTVQDPIDINGNGEIEVSEAEAITRLGIAGPIHDYTGMEAFTNLDTLSIGNVNAFDIVLPHMTGLKIFGLGDGTNFNNVDLTACTNLEKVDCAFVDSIRSLNVSGLTNLRSIRLQNAGLCKIGSINARNCSSLLSLDCALHGYLQGSLDVTGCTALHDVSIDYSFVPSLDFSSCTSLDALVIGSVVSNLQDLNLKNGRMLSWLDLHFVNYNPVLNVCADDFEIDSIRNYLLSGHVQNPPYSSLTFNVSATCTFLPAGNYNTITGTARFDMNNNGCDNGDAGFNNLPVKITNTSGEELVRYTAVNGIYAHYCQAGDFTIMPYFPYPYFNISPLSTIVNFPAANNAVDTKDFCITPSGTHNDLVVTLLPLTPARFVTNTYQLVYTNRGTTALSGNVQLNFDNGRMSFTSSSVAPNSQSTGQLTWNYYNLLPFESRTIKLYFHLFPPPGNNIGDTIFFLANISPVINDETPTDNSFILPQQVVGGYDPNDKECLQGGKLDIAHIGRQLDYLIRFQNVGNDTAFNVVVVDTLSNKLDWSSIEVIATCHPCDIKQVNGKLEFYFRDINLPYQAINDAGSNGFVAFKIKPKSNLVIGDSLNNKAAIYFDFNLPVITNTATTVISPTSSVPVILEYFSLTTKNETNLLTWKAPSTTGTTNFGIERSNDGIHFSNLGNITANVDRCQLPFNFTDENPFDGKTYYRLNIKDADGISFYSKVLVAGRTKSGLSINAVVSDRNNTTIYLNASKAQNLQMKIIAADGRLMYNQSKTVEAGSSTFNLPLRNLATGIYTLLVYTEQGELITSRFIK